MKLLLVCVLACVILLVVSAAENQVEDCPSSCAEDFSPVCAEDSGGEKKIFSNECELGRYNCNNNSDFVPFKNGTCFENPKKKSKQIEEKKEL